MTKQNKNTENNNNEKKHQRDTQHKVIGGVCAGLADYNDGQPTLNYTSGGANSITLDCGTGVTLDATTATDFTIMLLAGTLANGFTLQAYDGTTLLFEKSNTATQGAEFISRSAIKKVNNPLAVSGPFTGLTFEAKAANSTVKFTALYMEDDMTGDGFYPTLEYSTDGITWDGYILDDIAEGEVITLANVGDKVMFRGDNETLGECFIIWQQEIKEAKDIIQAIVMAGSWFQVTGECYVYGNVMSLLDKEDYATATTVPGSAFALLFANNTNIFNHPSHHIVLPATTLARWCYADMFTGCTNLTTAPVLPPHRW